MALKIGDTAPDFAAETSNGTVRFQDWIGDAQVVPSSHAC
jgi:thioredoxin-dependent peroxiredoxin